MTRIDKIKIHYINMQHKKLQTIIVARFKYIYTFLYDPCEHDGYDRIREEIRLNTNETLGHRSIQISKRAERSMLESSASNAEGNVSNKDEEKTEEIDVMDYAQPHRKPPIHNKGT